MVALSTMLSNVGAGVSQVRSQNQSRPVRMTEQQGPANAMDARSAALTLIQRALVVSETTGHDLDVLA